MRALILGLSVLAIVASPHAAEAGLSTTPREMSASVDPASLTDEATQETEDQIRLTKAKRREVQRGLTRLGFDTKVNGKFNDSTRDAIGRWQEEHGYPKTGFLNTAQHRALLNEGTATTEVRDQHRGGRRIHRARGIGGPIGAIGGAVHGVVGGLFRR
jgi:peptidoglycan hydrolase-like protein with peptidoglycan-binding domain